MPIDKFHRKGIYLCIGGVIGIIINTYSALQESNKFAILNMAVAFWLTYQTTRIALIIWEDLKDANR